MGYKVKLLINAIIQKQNSVYRTADLVSITSPSQGEIKVWDLIQIERDLKKT